MKKNRRPEAFRPRTPILIRIVEILLILLIIGTGVDLFVAVRQSANFPFPRVARVIALNVAVAGGLAFCFTIITKRNRLGMWAAVAPLIYWLVRTAGSQHAQQLHRVIFTGVVAWQPLPPPILNYTTREEVIGAAVTLVVSEVLLVVLIVSVIASRSVRRYFRGAAVPDAGE